MASKRGTKTEPNARIVELAADGVPRREFAAQVGIHSVRQVQRIVEAGSDGAGCGPLPEP